MKYYCLALHPQAKKPTFVHSSIESAEKEASRISMQLDCDVLVLQAVSDVQSFKTTENLDFSVSFREDGEKIIVSNFDKKDDLPF